MSSSGDCSKCFLFLNMFFSSEPRPLCTCPWARSSTTFSCNGLLYPWAGSISCSSSDGSKIFDRKISSSIPFLLNHVIFRPYVVFLRKTFPFCVCFFFKKRIQEIFVFWTHAIFVLFFALGPVRSILCPCVSLSVCPRDTSGSTTCPWVCSSG